MKRRDHAAANAKREKQHRRAEEANRASWAAPQEYPIPSMDYPLGLRIGDSRPESLLTRTFVADAERRSGEELDD